MEIRLEVRWFSEFMESKLRLYEGKKGDSWKEFNIYRLFQRLRKEVEEIKEIMPECESKEEVRKLIDECADVANFAMMIAHNATNELTEIK